MLHLARNLLCKAIVDTCCVFPAIDQSNQLFKAPLLFLHCRAPSGLRAIMFLRPLRSLRLLRPLRSLRYGIKHGDKRYVMQLFKRLI